MPEPTPRPRLLQLVTAIGYLEALGLLLYGVSIIWFEQGGATSGISGSGADLAPAVLIGLFLVFAGLVSLVTWMVNRGRRAARTPYVMVQAFALVIAQPLLSAGSTRILGLLLAVVAAAGIVAILNSSVREYLR